MSGKNKARGQRVDHRGAYRQLPVRLLESGAWAGLSMRARCILIALLRRFSGYNNGSIAASSRDLADAIGSHRYAANRAAIGELVAAGIVAIERVHPNGSRMATEYRLTFIETGGDQQRRTATNEWEAVESGNKRKNSPHESSTRNRERADAASTDGERSADAPSTVTTGTSQKPTSPPVDALSAHIVNHLTGVSSGGIIPLRAPERAGRAPHESSCIMDAGELREFAKGCLACAEVGAQTKLADASGVPGSSLSKFLAGKNLADAHRLKLQLAVGRAWPLEHRRFNEGAAE